MSMKSLLLHKFLTLALILLICDLRSLMILLQFLTQLFRMDLCVLQMICFFLEWLELFNVEFDPFGDYVLT